MIPAALTLTHHVLFLLCSLLAYIFHILLFATVLYAALQGDRAKNIKQRQSVNVLSSLDVDIRC